MPRGHTGINRERPVIGLGAHQVINRLATMAPVVDHDPEALVQPLCNAPPALCLVPSSPYLNRCVRQYPTFYGIASVRPDSTMGRACWGVKPCLATLPAIEHEHSSFYIYTCG